MEKCLLWASTGGLGHPAPSRSGGAEDGVVGAIFAGGEAGGGGFRILMPCGFPVRKSMSSLYADASCVSPAGSKDAYCVRWGNGGTGLVANAAGTNVRACEFLPDIVVRIEDVSC